MECNKFQHHHYNCKYCDDFNLFSTVNQFITDVEGKQCTRIEDYICGH